MLYCCSAAVVDIPSDRFMMGSAHGAGRVRTGSMACACNLAGRRPDSSIAKRGIVLE
jgi:hypothetical protein